MLKVGLTGGIGSGKTTVSDLFKKLNVSVIDTDIIARNLIDNNTEVTQEIINFFGEDVITGNGMIDRKKLAAAVFKDKTRKQQLENILHPKIRREVNHQITRFGSQKTPPAYIIIVIPLLFETDFHDLVDRTLVVMADKDSRITRVQQRDNRSVEEINSIISHQIDDTERRDAADDIIVNNGSIVELKPQIDDLHAKYTDLAKT